MSTQQSVELLNKAVADELATVHQYMYFHFHLDDMGYGPLAVLFKRTAIVEMGHVEKLAERILFLKGDVEMVPGFAVEKITDPVKMLAKAAAMEASSARDYNQWARQCGENLDSATKKLFEALVGDEETHFDAFDKQQEHIQKFGPAYLALQSFGKEEAATPAE
ncbi:MAG TPA: ferritin-like domain-containing protein [Terracidiphilus sp.]